MNIYFDTETIPGQDAWVLDYITQTIKPPATMKKQETIDKWYIEESDNAILEALGKTSFDGAMNHIVCIGAAIDDGNVITFSASKPDEEAGIIKAFYDFVSGCEFGHTFIGHNSLGFDTRVLRHRSIILGVKPPEWFPFEAKPWDNSHYDTMLRWDAKNFISQDKLAKALGFEGKKGMDGSDVYPEWKAGNYEKISAYCADDVETVRKIYKRMTFKE